MPVNISLKKCISVATLTEAIRYGAPPDMVLFAAAGRRGPFLSVRYADKALLQSPRKRVDTANGWVLL